MTQTLHNRFKSLVGPYEPAPLVTDVAFALPGGLEGAASAFNGDIEADIYARPHNPTVSAFATVINKLEGGVGALAYASGQAAIRNVIQLLTTQDTEIVVSSHIFGGTTAIHSGLLSRYGITFKWADATNPSSFEQQITNKTRAFLFESVANPAGDIADFNGLKDVASRHNIPLIVDNTTAPLLLRPIDHGADVVVYSATKYINGQANAPAGIVVDAGRFNWKNDPRYHALSASFRGLPSVAQKFNERAFIKGLQSQLTVDGSILSPEKAAIIHENLYSLPERLAGHIANTAQVSEFLSAHPAVESVRYAGLKNDPNHKRAKQYLPEGVAGPIMVTLKGGKTAAAHVIDHLGRNFLHAVNIGDANRNLVSHPATTTHRQLSETQRVDIGIKDGSLRLSISSINVQETLSSLDDALRYCPPPP